MEYEKRIHSQAGNYIVTDTRDFESVLNKRSLEVDGLSVNVGELTDLHSWFSSPVLFCGFLDENEAIFFLGKGDSDLFQTGGFYYDLTYIIDSNRIGKSYKAGTFRDSFLREKNNKICWK